MRNTKRILSKLLLLVLVVGLGGGCTRTARRNRAIAAGDKYFAAEDYDKAEASYLQAARMMAPPSEVALRQLGLLYMAEGRPTPTAVWCLQQASKAEPDNVKILIELAAALQQDAHLAEAKELAYRILKLQPYHERALVILCETARSTEEAEQTRQYIEKLRQQDKERGVYHLAFGYIDANEGNYAAAGDEYRKAQALDPNLALLPVAVAEMDVATGDPKAAEQVLKNAAEKAALRSPVRTKYAQFQFQHGETNEAVAALQEINRKAPDYMPASLLLMSFSYAERKYDECNAYIAKISEREPGNLEAQMQKGLVSMAKGDGKQAVADFQHVSDLTAQQPSPDVQFQLAQAYLLNGDRNKAIAILNHALEIKTNYIPGRLLLSKLEIRQGEAASAIALLTETLKFPQLPDPIVAEANLILANAYLAQKAPGPAAAIYQRMEVTFPKNAQMPYLAGRAMVRNSQPEPARVEFEKSLALDPEFTPSLQELVDLDLAKANYSAAMARVQAEINKHPTNAMPLLLKARVCMAAKDVPQAEAALQKVLSLDPNLPAAYLMLARLYVDNHQEKEALQKLTTLVGMTNDITALMEIGQIHELDKEYDPARNSYETLLNLSPKFGGALNNLAYLFSEHYKDQSKAYDLAEKAHEIAPFDAYVDDTLGWILFKRGEYPRALALEEESAAKHPSDPDVQYHMGMCHYMLGEEELARLAFQNSASKSDYENREEVLHRLAIIAVDPKTATPADRTLLEKEIEKEPSDPVATMRLAALQERDGELDKAAATYEGAIQKNPKDVRAAARLGQLYATKLNKPEKGMELAKNAHQQAPDDPFVSAILGRLVFQARDYPYALSLLQAAARGMAGQPDLMHDLAWAYFSTGNIPKAQTSMEAALQTGIAFAKIEDAKQFLAMLAVCGNPAQTQAAAKVQQAVQADANYAPALMAQGLVEEQQGHPKVAEQSYEKLLTLYPLFAPANRQLAILYARDGDDPKAFACAEKARSTFPDDAELGKYAGLAAYHLKNFSVSSQYLTQSTAKLRDDGEALYYLGMDYFQLKDNANSKKTLQQAVKSKLPGDLAAEANKVLAQLK